MRRLRLAFLPTLFFVTPLATPIALAIVVGGAGCDVSLNLGLAGDGAPLPTCDEVCSRLIDTCHLGPDSQRAACLSQCAQARPIDLECAVQTACLAIINVCGAGSVDASGIDLFDAADNYDSAPPAEYEIQLCQNGCNIANNAQCSSASELSACLSHCETASASPRSAYANCAENAGGDCSRQADCYSVFIAD